MLKIVKADLSADAASGVLEELRSRAEQGKRGMLLVPESGSHQAERQLLSYCGNRAGEYVTVTTFSKLTDDVLELTGAEPETLDAGGRVLMMHRALSAVQSSLEYYRRAGRPQLTQKLLEVASELQACAVTPEQLLQAGHLSPKIRDLGLIYTQYCHLCETSGLDPAARIDFAVERLAESKLVKDCALYLRGFEGFTAQKYVMVEALLCQCESMTVVLQWGEDAQLYTEQRKTLERLRRIAENCGIPVQVVDSPAHGDADLSGLKELSCSIYDFKTKEIKACNGLELYDLSDEESECELAAGWIRQKALEGVRLREMAVVCGDLEHYGPMLSAAFEKYGIPLFLSEKNDLLQKPALTAALGPLEALEDGCSFTAVIDWLRRGLTGIEPDDIDRLENYCFLWQISGNQWFRPFTSPTCGFDRPMSDEAFRLNRLNGIRERAAAPLQALKQAFAACRSGADFADALSEYLKTVELESVLSARCAALQQQNKGREAAETAQLYHILTEALRQFAAAMADVMMDLREFSRLLRLMLSQYDVSAIPPSLDSVLAVTFERLPESEIRCAVIVGGREGLFPPDKASVSLLSETERIRLEGEGVELTQSALDRAWQQQGGLCRAVASPRERLVITCPRCLSDGTACRPAYVFTRIKNLTGKAAQDGEALLSDLRLTAVRPLKQLASRGAEAPSTPQEAAALEHACKEPSTRAFLEQLRSYSVSPRGPIADREVTRRLYGGALNLTATRIERIASCRFSYFMQYGLKAQAKKQARFGAPEIGTFVHYVVENAIKELCRAEEPEPHTVTRKYVERYLEEELPAGEKTARFLTLFNQAGELACEIVRNVWEEIQAGDFRPICFELDFSRKGDLPPLTLQEGDITLTVGGKIDRVDGFIRDDTLYLKVVDYKTGTKQFRLSDVLYGLNLQMFLYLMMLQQGDQEKLRALIGAADADRTEPCGALYIPAKSPFVAREAGETSEAVMKKLDRDLRRIGLVSSDPVLLDAMEKGGTFRFLPVGYKKDGSFTEASSVASAEQLGRLLRKTEQILRKIARQIGGGDVEAAPYRKGRDHTACDYCDFKDACLFDTTMKKDKLRFLPNEKNARVHEILEEEEQKGKGASECL